MKKLDKLSLKAVCDLGLLVDALLVYEFFHIDSKLPDSLLELSYGLSKDKSVDGEEHHFFEAGANSFSRGEFKDPWGFDYLYDPVKREIECREINEKLHF